MSAILDVRRGSRARRSKKRRRAGGEPIKMQERRHGYFPKVFVWRGHRYYVHAVERCWTVSRRGGRVDRHYFRVRCKEGTFKLYQDVRHNTWHIQR